jgi:hypothetical protein
MKKSLIFFLVMFYLIIFTKTALSYDYNWSNYTEPYNNTVNVLLYKGSIVYVDLPADYIRNNSAVALHIDLQSNITYMIDGLKQKGFEGFSPMLSVNRGIIFGNYTIPVKALPVRQMAMINIKTKYLKAGKNALKFFLGREGGVRYSCKGGKACIAFYVHKIWFDDFTSKKETKITQLAMTEEEPKQVSYREEKDIDGSFEGEIINMNGWNFGELFQQRTGKEGFQKIYIDKGQGAEGTYRYLVMNFKLGSTRTKQSERPRLPIALLVNRLKRDLSGYTGIEFHIRATKDLNIVFGLADSETGASGEERWNRILSVTTEWEKMRIPFNSLSLAKNRALSQGTNQILELNNIEAIHWVAHGRIVPIGTEGTIYLDEISFY